MYEKPLQTVYASNTYIRTHLFTQSNFQENKVYPSAKLPPTYASRNKHKWNITTQIGETSTKSHLFLVSLHLRFIQW